MAACSQPPPHKAHLPREVTLLIEVHVLVFLAVHPQPKLERFSVSTKAELELAQTVEEFGQVAAHLREGPWSGWWLWAPSSAFKPPVS